ncbi:MAG TPA: HDOD domain-containing protein [Lacipirellulaceae bacterium]
MNDITSRVEQIAARASALYSRPTVALEIVRLASEPQADARQIKECLEQDPALTSKILRVVNSSFFSLPREVADLNQAVALLGIKPLKLLVLGFSLPDEMFAETAADQLQWYWTTTLTRAVAARLLSTELWHAPSDEAFIAGMLQDIGILALLRELGPPYVKLLSRVIDQRRDLAALERDCLGFNHVDLSAALLTHWKLPQRLIDAVAIPKQVDSLLQLVSADSDLPRILHLAELLAQLVGQRRLDVLPELMKAGGAYCDLTKGRLMVLVEKLQPQVDQLAQALSLELAKDRNYVDVLVAAHAQLASLTEELAGEVHHHRSEDQVYTDLLQEAQELTHAMHEFLQGNRRTTTSAEPPRSWNHWHAPHERTEGERAVASTTADDSIGIVALLRHLTDTVPSCRARRQELSLVLVETNAANMVALPDHDVALQIRQTLESECRAYGLADMQLLSITASQVAAILPGCERRQAVALANEVLAQFVEVAPRTASKQDAPQAVHTITVSAGVATVAAIPKNFDPWRLVESAERCLYAARSCNTNTVKSIEM